jgi:hypothetical protein
MSLSYQEKSALASLVAVLVVYWYYFGEVRELMRNDQLDAASALGLMIGAVVVLVIIEVVFQILISAISRSTATDERDKLIFAKAARNSGILLGAGTITLILAILASEIRGGLGDPETQLTPILIAQWLILLMVMAQIFEYLSQIFYYRRGV